MTTNLDHLRGTQAAGIRRAVDALTTIAPCLIEDAYAIRVHSGMLRFQFAEYRAEALVKGLGAVPRLAPLGEDTKSWFTYIGDVHVNIYEDKA